MSGSLARHLSPPADFRLPVSPVRATSSHQGMCSKLRSDRATPLLEILTWDPISSPKLPAQTILSMVPSHYLWRLHLGSHQCTWRECGNPKASSGTTVRLPTAGRSFSMSACKAPAGLQCSFSRICLQSCPTGQWINTTPWHVYIHIHKYIHIYVMFTLFGLTTPHCNSCIVCLWLLDQVCNTVPHSRMNKCWFIH